MTDFVNAVVALFGAVFAISAAFSFAIYFLPTIIALFRGHNAAFSLFLINTLLGWTFVFWLVCLVWALAGAKLLRRPLLTRRPRPSRLNFD